MLGLDQIRSTVLEGRWVRLVPLKESHAKALYEVAEPDTFQYYVSLQPLESGYEGFLKFVRNLIDYPNCSPWAVQWKETGELIGATTFLDMRLDQRGLEIGMTWYGKAWKGTKVNPECKLLLLQFAFVALGMLRVQLKTDGRNLHSQAAIRKLGAHYEGTLRKHGIQPNGFVRDTVMFSILDHEWPTVRTQLEARLVGP